MAALSLEVSGRPFLARSPLHLYTRGLSSPASTRHHAATRIKAAVSANPAMAPHMYDPDPIN